MAGALPGTVTFVLTVGTLALVYAMLALGLNVHFGYTGLLNFGHVAFFTAGAYTAALVTMPVPGPAADYALGLGVGMPHGLLVSLPLAAVAGGVLAALIGATSVRLESHYLAIATFALAQLFHSIVQNERWLTRGSNGLNQVPRPAYAAFPSGDLWLLAYFAFVAVLVGGVYLLVERLGTSPFGRVLKGVREDETAARMLGKDTTRLKLKSFALGGAIAGLAGGVYAHYVGSVSPQQFLPLVTFLVWVMMILGGIASNEGVILGAVLLVAFRDFSGFLPSVPGYPLLVEELRWAFIGLMLILLVRWRPEGLLGNPGEIVMTDEGGDG